MTVTEYSVEIKHRTQPSAAEVRQGHLVHFICWAGGKIIDHGFAASEASAKARAQVAIDAHAAGDWPGWTEPQTVEIAPNPQPDLPYPGLPDKRRSWKWSGWGK